MGPKERDCRARTQNALTTYSAHMSHGRCVSRVSSTEAARTRQVEAHSKPPLYYFVQVSSCSRVIKVRSLGCIRCACTLLCLKSPATVGGDGDWKTGGSSALSSWQSQPVPLYRLLQDCAFEPAAIDAMSGAFEEVCRKLGLAELSDPLRDMVAKKVIEFAQQGERDQVCLTELTLAAFSDRSSA
jgi:hypothetical protein